MPVAHLQLIVGEFGSGKSLFAVEHCLALAERYRKAIVTNFSFDIPQLLRYCEMKGYTWIPKLVRWRRIIVHPCRSCAELDAALSYRNSIILIDEAGIFLNARSWSRVSQDFLSSLVQCRKDGNFLIFVCHFLEQVDKQLRENVQEFIECRALTIYDRRLKNDRILIRWRHHFKPRRYHQWIENMQARNNMFLTWLMADFSPIPQLYIPFSVKIYPYRHGSFIDYLLRSQVKLETNHLGQIFRVFRSYLRLDKVGDRRLQDVMTFDDVSSNNKNGGGQPRHSSYSALNNSGHSVSNSARN